MSETIKFLKKTWHKDAIELHLKAGLSGRKIAALIGRSKSQVNDVIKAYKSFGGFGVTESPKGTPAKGTPAKGTPKVLVFDLETSPELSYHFGRYQVNIQDTFNVLPSYLLSFSAKWLGQDEIITMGLPYFDDYDKDNLCDKRLCYELHKLLDEADVVIAHNLKGFDWKVAQTRLILNGFDPISPTKLVDTLLIARSNFKFPTNRLDTIARQLGVGEKLQHSGASLWMGCLQGDEESWNMMLEYNTVDVEILESVYLKLRPYDKTAPNMAILYDDNELRCVCCGSTNLELTDKRSFTGTSSYQIHRCKDCGKHNRSRTNVLPKDKRKSLLANAT